MTKPISRFSYDAPGWFRMIWYMTSSGWREKIRAWITDHERGERFQLSEDEELLMQVLSDNMAAVTDLMKVPLWKSDRFWTHEKIDLARDHILAAISARRHGDASEWQRLKAMEPHEWIKWLNDLGGRQQS